MPENTEDNRQTTLSIWDFEAEQNWQGFWDLLLKEDMRQNPDLYKEQMKNG